MHRLAGMESPPRYSETLEHILHFLRTEGFYAAEDALRGEIENRFPEGSSPVATSTSSQQLPAVGKGIGDDPGAAFTLSNIQPAALEAGPTVR